MVNGSLKGKEFYEMCSMISEKNENIITKFFDIRYNINIKSIIVKIPKWNYGRKNNINSN